MAYHNTMQRVKYLLNRATNPNVSLKRREDGMLILRKGKKIRHHVSTIYSMNTETWNTINKTVIRNRERAVAESEGKKLGSDMATFFAIGLTVVVPILLFLVAGFLTSPNSF
jgi:hypothetical protein